MRFKRELATVLGAAALGSLIAKKPKLSTLALAGAGAALLWPRRLAGYEGKSVVITGGSRGLGFELARQCLAQGASVTMLARDPDELDRACDILGRDGRLFTIVCDVTKCESLDRALAEARARFGKIDVLINNAGSILAAPFVTMEDEEFRAQMDLHVLAIATSLRLIRPYFHQNGGGHVINISSIGGLVPVPHLSAYSASKFALSGLSRAVAAELASENIQILTAYPGLMRTGSAIQAVFKGKAQEEFALFAALANTPIVSVSAEHAARVILNASLDGRSQVIVSGVAKLAAIAVAVFPELTASIMAAGTRALPSGGTKDRHLGAEFRDELKTVRPLDQELKATELENNEQPHTKPDVNLGLH